MGCFSGFKSQPRTVSSSPSEPCVWSCIENSPPRLSISLHNISLLSGLIDWYDHNRNQNINNRDNLIWKVTNNLSSWATNYPLTVWERKTSLKVRPTDQACSGRIDLSNHLRPGSPSLYSMCESGMSCKGLPGLSFLKNQFNRGR